MRYSQLLIPTVKEVPAEAEVPSHRLMIRAGFIRKLASGTYTYLPLGWRSLMKIMGIVREEMNAAGAQEILMPIVQPVELWQRTGRDKVYDDILGRFTDHHGRVNVLAPTAEEVVTSLAAGEVASYKQLPINLYQINTKFRDEFRPQYGVIRSREFMMKDAYSFDTGVAGLEASYRKMYEAYCRIFARCGLKTVVVEAESGGMGGTDTEEFMVPCAVGDLIAATEDGSYAANIDRAEVDPLLRQELDGVPPVAPMEDVHTPGTGSIEAVCAFLKTRPEEMIKTLVYAADGRPAAALVRGDHETNEAKLARALGAEDVALADEATIESVTGAAVGFAGPMGLAEKVEKMVIDHAVAAMAVGVSGANKTDYHTRNVVPGRDFPLQGPNVVIADVRNAGEGDTHDGKKLLFSRGVEVGHVFKLGTKYSRQLGATFLDENGAAKPCAMGCYGIGINRILAMAIESDHDENGCILPVSIAPFELLVLPINNDSPEVVAEAERIYNELRGAGVDVLLDDRDVRPGVKFKDADLLGIPLRIAVGDRSLKAGKVEIKRRTDAKPAPVAAADAVAEARKILTELKDSLKARAQRPV
jgi:prolyl-tRNA synthetase